MQNVDMALPFEESLTDILGEYTRRSILAGHSERTIKSKTSLVLRLQRSGVSPLDATSDELAEWVASLDLSRSSRATYRTQLRAWFAWLAESGRREDNPADGLPQVRVPRGTPHPLTPKQVQAVLAACADSRARQTRAYVLLAAYAGLRAHEIAKLRGDDVGERELTVVGKGGVASTVPLPPVLARLAEQMPQIDWWFPSPTGVGPVSRVSVSIAIQRAFQRAGIQAVPHSLRHFYCTQALRSSGGDLRLTQRLARHASPATTAIYTQVLDEAAAAAVVAIPGAE